MGRRSGTSQTREAILDAAMAAFAEHGYGKTTIRGVAREAGVDPALVMHFFGTKDGLFDAAIKGGAMPIRQLQAALDGDPGQLGERLITRYLELWSDPEQGPLMLAVITAATSTPAAAELLKELMRGELLRPLIERLGADHPEERAVLAATQLLGLAVLRYVIRIEPLASMPAPALVASVGPTLQRYLTGAVDFAG
ncbi:TetR family transcriptional regulator [Nonomuraea sp. NPDC050310]|uniref:TetR/AcrR family transcriptional regulator n=1 Tax=unclassified Nonomuraea TaxID=2593643 RepID=UPI0033E853A6